MGEAPERFAVDGEGHPRRRGRQILRARRHPPRFHSARLHGGRIPRRGEAGREHDNAAARAQPLSLQRKDDNPQGARNRPRDTARAHLHQGPAARNVPQHDIHGPRHLRHRGGVARIFRQGSREARHQRIRGARRPRSRAGKIFAVPPRGQLAGAQVVRPAQDARPRLDIQVRLRREHKQSAEARGERPARQPDNARGRALFRLLHTFQPPAALIRRRQDLPACIRR